MPRRCLGAIRRVASHSTCGAEELITCCVPHQQDCRRDPHPGDGKAEGTCGRTNKPCDKVEDCMVRRCQPAVSADSCRAKGGTLGNGKDCSTACAP